MHVHACKLTHMEFLWKSEAAKIIVSEENQEAGSRMEKSNSPLFWTFWIWVYVISSIIWLYSGSDK